MKWLLLYGSKIRISETTVIELNLIFIYFQRKTTHLYTFKKTVAADRIC